MEERVLNVLASICEDDIVKQERDIDLFETGLLDSMGFIEMMVDIEEEFNIRIAPSELDREEINTPQKIINMVLTRMNIWKK